MADKVYKSMSFANPDLPGYDIIQKISVALGLAGVLVMMLACLDIQNIMTPGYLTSSLLLISVGVILFSWRTFLVKHEGIRNDGIWQRSLTNRGLWGWILGVLVTIFYVLLYWFPALIGLSGSGNTGLVAFFDPLSMLLKGTPASQWFVYGVLYTVAIIIFGIRFIWKYRHNRYQVFRTCSVMFFQLGFAFLIPEFLQKLNYPYNDMKNMWPLNYYFFDEWNIKALLGSGSPGFWMLVLGVLMIFIISPVLTYLYGKR
ncbi:MAG: FeS-binding protein, partial [Saprospiraceae bacterium]|nr:FeS-binding protein [Saprospiraceae bacterium]